MNKIVLAYNFKPERLQQLRQVCMILKVNCKAVPLPCRWNSLMTPWALWPV